MRCLFVSLLLYTLLLVSPATAQQPVHNANEERAWTPDTLPSMSTQTPEMWFYMQEMRRHDDPQLAVRRKAEEAAQQRRDRMAAMKWFGLSNQRPVANPVPWMASYSPSWSGNSWDPYRWVGSGSQPRVIVVDPYNYGR